jgi:hypothetical protein
VLLPSCAGTFLRRGGFVGRPALDYEAAGGLYARSQDFEAGSLGQFGELGERIGLAACDQHVDAQGSRCVVG